MCRGILIEALDDSFDRKSARGLTFIRFRCVELIAWHRQTRHLYTTEMQWSVRYYETLLQETMSLID